ncbi:MAG: NADPH:quinone oxidoreductase family protein [Paracoccaceae bacterium]|nr:NADPH:quinone oxidoreductase family protein [Paracoccaceae bacterium]
MHAVVVKSIGDVEIVDDWQPPQVGSGDVKVKTLACGLNFADLLMIKGDYQDTPTMPFVPGMEICGEIIATGQDVRAFSTGDRITAFCQSGGLASETVVSAARCVRAPSAMPDEVAAGFQITYGTSHLALDRRARLRPGETLLVLGAAGGVGLTAVEIGKGMGARVIAVARGAKKLEIATQAGADEVIDATSDNLLTAFKSLGPIDVVYDAVGGEMGQAALRALAPEGRYLAIGFASGTVPEAKLNHLLVKNIDVIGFYWGGYLRFNADALKTSMSTLFEWYKSGKISPKINHVLPLSQVKEGLELLRTRTSTGKVVITL